jgi:hypothetical protein
MTSREIKKYYYATINVCDECGKDEKDYIDCWGCQKTYCKKCDDRTKIAEHIKLCPSCMKKKEAIKLIKDYEKYSKLSSELLNKAVKAFKGEQRAEE